MKLSQLLLCCAGVFVAASATAIIDPSLKQRFLPGMGGDTQNVMISFTQGIDTVINQINSMSFSSPAEKRTVLTNAQKTFSGASQGQLQNFLNSMGVNYESFWINNKMVVPNVNSALVDAISNIPGVAKIEKEPVANIELPVGGEELLEDFSNMTRFARQSATSPPQYGIAKIRADQVWGSYKGKGIVVAGIDTGVRYTHDALKGRWRSSYGWYDPYKGTSLPNDGNGHGTHTMGTIAGINGIGVAPEATWIACMGCNSDSCSGSALYACGQWVQCPTDPKGQNQDCTKAPDVVSNSWGGGQGQTWFDEIINSWQAAGITPVFSIGNSGSGCNTAGSPGDRPKVISVGSTDSSDRISTFSSRGPTSDGRVKPEISAPGGQVRSAWHTGNSVYNTISGTSMACPHVSGVVALMKQKNRAATFSQIFNAITNTAERTGLNKSGAATCGGTSADVYPNNIFGYGRIDAVRAVGAI